MPTPKENKPKQEKSLRLKKMIPVREDYSLRLIDPTDTKNKEKGMSKVHDEDYFYD